MVVVARSLKPLNQDCRLKVMCTAKILERIAMIAQGGIDQTDEKMWIGRTVVTEIHQKDDRANKYLNKLVFSALGVEVAAGIVETFH